MELARISHETLWLGVGEWDAISHFGGISCNGFFFSGSSVGSLGFTQIDQVRRDEKGQPSKEKQKPSFFAVMNWVRW